MKQNNKMTFSDCIKVAMNLFLTGDSKTEFRYNQDGQGENTDLKNSFKKQKVFLIGIAGLILVIFLSMCCISLVYINGKIPMYLMVAIGGIGYLLIFLVGLRFYKLIKNNTNQYDKDIVEKAIHSVLQEAEISPRGFVNARKLYFRGIVPDFTNDSGSYLISYKKEGRVQYFCNLDLVYNNAVDNTPGKVVTTFRGQVYVLSAKKSISGSVRIIVGMHNESFRSWFRKKEKDEVQIKTESVLFNESFTVFTTNEHEAFYILTPYVMEQLLNMKNRYGNFGISIAGSEIVIALNTGYFLLNKPQEYKDIENMSIENGKKQMQQILSFANSMEDLFSGNSIVK